MGSRLENPDGSVQDSTFRFHGLANQLDGALSLGPASSLLRRWALVPPRPDQACRVDWVSGASLMVHRACWEELGGLDEGYFLYYEEVDLCLRAARAGWSCWFEPRSRVIHLVGQATAVDPSRAVRRLPGYVLDSRRRYFVKNHGRAYAVLDRPGLDRRPPALAAADAAAGAAGAGGARRAARLPAPRRAAAAAAALRRPAGRSRPRVTWGVPRSGGFHPECRPR